MFIEKFFTHCENKDVSGSFQVPPISFGSQNYGAWPLRIALLLIGVGIGCLFAFFTWLNVKNVATTGWYDIQDFISFSYIAIFGGIGLLVSYLIESWQSKKK
jgi:xanthine/uracil permease